MQLDRSCVYVHPLGMSRAVICKFKFVDEYLHKSWHEWAVDYFLDRESFSMLSILDKKNPIVQTDTGINAYIFARQSNYLILDFLLHLLIMLGNDTIG